MRRPRFRPHGSPGVYGVLVGTVTDGAENPDTTHYEILVDVAGQPFRLAVNIKSQDGSEDIVFFDRSFKGDTKVGLSALIDGPAGFQELTTGAGGKGLDYLRDQDLVDIHMMQGNLPDPDPKFDHSRDNRINGDGALFIRFSNDETVALFSRFKSQSTDTDDNGNAV